MAISGVSGCSTCSSAAVDQDVQVKTLKAKIEDWSTCPTTDPQSKKEIVGRLQIELDAATASITASVQAKADESKSQDPVPTPGLGATIDLRV